MALDFTYHKTLSLLKKGCEDYRSYFIPYHSEAAAATGNRNASERFVTLCGEWDFRYYPSITQVEDFTAEDFAPASWDKMTVPMSWQMKLGQGYDLPHYTNVNYPFPLDPPHVPSVNPCALYRRTVEISAEELKNYRINIVFEGVDSCFYLYINNKFVAYSQGSHKMAEVALSDHLVAGVNEIKMLVVKWCDGSYLEDQDKIRLSGIFRETYLLLRDPVCIKDLYVRTPLNDDLTDATVRAELDLNGDTTVAYKLCAPNGKLIAEGKTDAKDGKALVEIPVKNPELWSDEIPSLYALYLTVGGEVICQKVGIRRFEVKGKILYVNNKAVKGKGVNRHDSNPILGYSTPLEHMLRDLYILKANNVNMIRTSHYPNDPRFMELCDQLGFYVCDEADLETHGANWYANKHWAGMTDEDEWADAYLDRAMWLMERDKNRACVLMWSTGNEAGIGINHKRMADYFHERMPGCIVHSERYNFYKHLIGRDMPHISPLKGKDWFSDYYVDVDSRMYPSVNTIVDEYMNNEDAKRPFFMCEYCHAMGNGPGDFKAYWDLIWKYDSFFGGCVWEMTDHSVDIGTPGNSKYIYGGDLGNYPNDGNFCCDGLVYPDRRLHTGMLEYKQVIRPAIITAFDAKKKTVTVRNRKYFTDLSDLDLCWTIEQNGRVIRQGRVPSLDVAPQTEKTFALELGDLDALTGYCYLNVFYRTNKTHPWADAGHEIGMEQFALEAAPNTAVKARSNGSFSVKEEGNLIKIKDGATVYTVSKATGAVVSIQDQGKEMLNTPIEFNIWRAPTDNDRVLRLKWEQMGYDRMKINCIFCKLDSATADSATVTAELHVGAVAMPNLIKATVTYGFKKGEGITLAYDVNVDQTPYEAHTLPRLGIQFSMSKGAEQLKYFGLGPVESYQDKRLAARMGLFASSVTGHFEHYVKPQENMAHADTKWAEVYTDAGHGLLITGTEETPAFSFNCAHYSPMQLTKTMHDYELIPLEETVVNVDFMQAGIGSHSCGDPLDPAYWVGAGDYKYSFRILPVFVYGVDPFAQ